MVAAHYKGAVRKVIENKQLKHTPVMLKEFLGAVPLGVKEGLYLDVTAGGGGHLMALLVAHPAWSAEAWDRDPDARVRVLTALDHAQCRERCEFFARDFGAGPRDPKIFYDFILADLGVSSFQLDDMSRGMSLYSEEALDFRMNPTQGMSFVEWIDSLDERKLTEILYRYGEEPKAQSLARQIKQWGPEAYTSAKVFAEHIARALRYKEPSRRHPATRVFQALRIAINDELGQLESLLAWAPHQLKSGGRLLVITFHSLEDRLVKHAFQKLSRESGFEILTPKPLVPSPEEETRNPRARSSKLRVLQKV
jgi:16S rRNA (cytosine1402-N4)-methyltransferase